jgi:putative Holliday junction resolvase
MTELPDYILALDVGEKRIGVAIASAVARLPKPLATLANDDNFFDALAELITSENVGALVVGLPRGLEGQTTAQTAYVQEFIGHLKQRTTLPIYEQDEALTSTKAEAELQAKGNYDKAAVDALAATYILDDFLTEYPPTDHV